MVKERGKMSDKHIWQICTIVTAKSTLTHSGHVITGILHNCRSTNSQHMVYREKEWTPGRPWVSQVFRDEEAVQVILPIKISRNASIAIFKKRKKIN